MLPDNLKTNCGIPREWLEALKGTKTRRMPQVKKSQWEEEFARLWPKTYATPVREYPFHPTRKWRFDFAWPDVKVAVEIEGGIYKIGRHQRPEGFRKDCEKYNEATRLGWSVLRFTPSDLTENPQKCIQMVGVLILTKRDMKGATNESP